MSKVWIVAMQLTVDGKKTMANTVVRAKSKAAAIREVIGNSVSARRATVDDFVPPLSAPVSELVSEPVSPQSEPGPLGDGPLVTPEPSNE